MKAAYYETYGPPEVVQLKEVEKPVLADDEVLVKIRAASVNQYDWHLLTADIFLVRIMGLGLLRPKFNYLGADIAGEVEAVGKAVTNFKPGDEVYGSIGRMSKGGFAEYAAAPERVIALKPANLTFEQAAAVPMAGVTALQGLRDDGKVQPGQQVLIYGASGGVGSFAVQVAKVMGAEVTAVCSTRNLEQSRKLGADYVIDYTKENFTELPKQYDMILGVNGYQPLSALKRVLKPHGIYAMSGGKLRQMLETLLFASWASRGTDKTLKVSSAKIKQEDLNQLRTWIEAGKITPLIDKCFPLSEVREALRYLGDGHARGKVIVSIHPAG